MQLPTNWFWPLLGFAVLLVGVVWGWGGLSTEEEAPEGPVGGLKAAHGRGGSQKQGGGAGQAGSGQGAGAGGGTDTRQQAGPDQQTSDGEQG